MHSVYVIDGARTPFLKSKNRPGVFSAGDLATQAGKTLLARQKFAPQELDEVILGCAAPSVDEVNIGRVAALRMGCGEKVPGWTVMRNCASGMQAIDSGINNIIAGRSSLVLAGGVDALSRAPLLYGDKMVPRPGVDLGTVAREKDLITREELVQWQRKEALRKNVIKVDDFPQDFGRADIVSKLAHEKTLAVKAA